MTMWTLMPTRACIAALTLITALAAARAEADPSYVAIEMEIEVSAPAAEVWSRVGGYCDIGEWFGIPCEITAGDGGIGTVRSLLGGRIVEVLVGRTELSYGYTQPATPGEHYDLYHGYLEAVPVTDGASKLLYTLMYDVSQIEDPDADVARRRAQFERALARMKEIAEAAPASEAVGAPAEGGERSE